MAKGLQPNRLMGGAPNSTGVKAYRVSNAYATAMGNGDPVALSNGTVVKYAAGNNPLGVAVGFEWIDPTSKKPVYSTIFPAATSSGGVISGDNRPIAYVADNPDQTFAINARAGLAVSTVDVGKTYTLSLAAPDTNGGFSNAVLQDAVTTVADAAVRVIGLINTPDNAFGVSGNAVEVVFVNHVFNT